MEIDLIKIGDLGSARAVTSAGIRHVIFETRQADHFTHLPFLHAVGPGAHNLVGCQIVASPLNDLLGVDGYSKPGRRQQVEKRDDRFGDVHHDGIVIHRFVGFQPGRYLGLATAYFQITIQRGDHVLRAEIGAVVELDASAQMKGVRFAVVRDVPGFGQ